MNRNIAGFLGLALLTLAPARALERPDKEFPIFQFPPTMIPRIDGQTDDWEIVPESYVIGTEELAETVEGKGTNHDLEDLDVAVRVGWVNGLNRLYFLYEAHDDYWNMYYRRGDIFEVAVDADRSGGPNIYNPQLSEWDSHFAFKGVHAQNYHIFTPPGEGRDWVFVWGCQPWIARLPYANHAYSYDFAEGESGRLVLEFWITPFDYAPYEGPERAVVSKLVEKHAHRPVVGRARLRRGQPLVRRLLESLPQDPHGLRRLQFVRLQAHAACQRLAPAARSAVGIPSGRYGPQISGLQRPFSRHHHLLVVGF